MSASLACGLYVEPWKELAALLVSLTVGISTYYTLRKKLRPELCGLLGAAAFILTVVAAVAILAFDALFW